MALEGQPIIDHKPGRIWENNPDTPITATALSKATDLSISYLDFKYNDPQNPHHREGTVLMTDPGTSTPIKLVLKRGIVFSIINQVDEVTYPHGQYKIFDTGLDDLWISYNNKDNQSQGITGWGQNKQWFIFICDERINNPETGKNTAQILISQSSKSPQSTQVPGTSDYYSEKDTRIIGGFKSNNSGYIIESSVWDISGKFHTVRAKNYMILDEYAVSDNGQHVYRPLKVSDLDADVSLSVGGDLNIEGYVNTGTGSDGGFRVEGSHYITANDGNGDFNIRVGHSPTEIFTENGYAFHNEFNQTEGIIKWQISQAGLAGNNIVWDNSFELRQDGNAYINDIKVLVDDDIVRSTTAESNSYMLRDSNGNSQTRIPTSEPTTLADGDIWVV